jgi:hypothetical protein
MSEAVSAIRVILKEKDDRAIVELAELLQALQGWRDEPAFHARYGFSLNPQLFAYLGLS